jgi:hypothetical protein
MNTMLPFFYLQSIGVLSKYVHRCQTSNYKYTVAPSDRGIQFYLYDTLMLLVGVIDAKLIFKWTIFQVIVFY